MITDDRATMAAAPSDFFKIERTPSAIKAELLPRLFEAWATTVWQQAAKEEAPLIFLDLQAGLDSAEPAPAALQLLRQVYKSTGSKIDLNKGISTLFHDADQDALCTLQEKVEQLPFYQDLVHLPVILSETDDETLAAELFGTVQPHLTFLDPTAAAIQQQALLHAVQAGTSDLLLLFSPKTLDTGVRKAKADSLLQAVWGEQLEQVKSFYKRNRNADRKEEFLLDCFEEILRGKGSYTLRFRINQPDKKHTSQYLVFAVKSEQAYLRFKELLERYSDYQEDGVPLYGANLMSQQMSLFHEYYKYSVERLIQELAQGSPFNNKTLQQVYEQHSLGTHYVLDNYRVAFERLMRLGKVRFINPKTGQPISKLTPTSLIRYIPKGL